MTANKSSGTINNLHDFQCYIYIVKFQFPFPYQNNIIFSNKTQNNIIFIKKRQRTARAGIVNKTWHLQRRSTRRASVFIWYSYVHICCVHSYGIHMTIVFIWSYSINLNINIEIEQQTRVTPFETEYLEPPGLFNVQREHPLRASPQKGEGEGLHKGDIWGQ